MPGPPAGTVTFLFTDIEGSTRLVQSLGDRYAQILADHRKVLVGIIEHHDGYVVDAHGDSVFAAFPRATDAAAAAIEAQRAMAAGQSQEDAALRVRMGLHTGEPLLVEGGYVGIDVHRAARICAAGHGGQILVSGTTRELIADDLPLDTGFSDLGHHRLKDLARPLQLFQLVTADLPGDFPALRSLSTFPNNLPNLLTSFVGRRQELADVKQLLTSGRLVTLTGVGGCGKTRLALQIAAELLESFPDGIWLADFTLVTDPALIEHAVIAALGIREEPARPIQQTLLDYLGPKKLLLLLDNCEHLLRASAGLSHVLLQSCPNLRILATSREPLGVMGETIYRMSPLAVPTDPAAPLETLTQFEATQLFVDRAVAVFPKFKLDAVNAKAAATICRRLQGIPLAIELAASRVRFMPVDQISERLQHKFTILADHGQVAMPQHRTLQAVMDWSYDLLSEREQKMLRRLSVFAGGFTLDAADEVCGGDAIRAPEVLDLLALLVDKSLVLYQPDQIRYGLLEMVRQYAWEKLQDAEESEAVRARHLRFYLSLAETAEKHLRGAEAIAWLDRLDGEHDNLRAALRWAAVESQDMGSAFRLAGALWWFWLVRGHWSEGRDWLERMLEQSAPAVLRVKVLAGAATLAHYQRDYARATVFSNESLALCRRLNDTLGIAHALSRLAEVARARGDYERAVALGEDSVALFQEARDPWGEALARLLLGITIERDGRERAEALFEQSLSLFRTVGDPWGRLNALGRLGRIARVRGDLTHARELYSECLTISERLGDLWGVAAALVNLGMAARGQGDYNRAQEQLERSLELFRKLGDRSLTTYALEELGLLAIYAGNSSQAVELLTQAVEISRGLGGDKLGLAVCLQRLGLAMHIQGNNQRARTLLEESLPLYRELHESIGIAACLSDLGKVLLHMGLPEEAARLQTESLRLRKAYDARPGVTECLERMGAVAGARGEYGRAVRLIAAAEVARAAIGIPLPPPERADHDRTLAAAQTKLGSNEFEATLAEGHRMTLDQAFSYALTEHH